MDSSPRKKFKGPRPEILAEEIVEEATLRGRRASGLLPRVACDPFVLDVLSVSQLFALRARISSKRASWSNDNFSKKSHRTCPVIDTTNPRVTKVINIAIAPFHASLKEDYAEVLEEFDYQINPSLPK
jgi:hypothetical protein